MALSRQAQPVTPVSDTAVIESYTAYASRGAQLVGPYSRYGWHHPGPLYFYVLAPFYALSGSLTTGLNAGALAVNLASVLVLAWVVVRAGGGVLAIVTMAMVALYAWRVAPILASPWNPHVIVLPTMALIVASAAILSGWAGLLPLAAVIATFVGQTHVGVLPSVLVVSAIASSVVLMAAVSERDPDKRRRLVRILAVTARRAGRVVVGADLGATLTHARQPHEALAVFCRPRRRGSAVQERVRSLDRHAGRDRAPRSTAGRRVAVSAQPDPVGRRVGRRTGGVAGHHRDHRRSGRAPVRGGAARAARLRIHHGAVVCDAHRRCDHRPRGVLDVGVRRAGDGGAPRRRAGRGRGTTGKGLSTRHLNPVRARGLSGGRHRSGPAAAGHEPDVFAASAASGRRCAR